MKKYEFKITGLDCANCANEIQEELSKNPDLSNVIVSFAKQKLSYETDKVSKEEVIEKVKSVEPEVEIIDYKEQAKDLKNEEKQKENKVKLKKHIARLIIGAVIALIGLYAPMPQVIKTIFVIAGYAILLYRTATNVVNVVLSE